MAEAQKAVQEIVEQYDDVELDDHPEETGVRGWFLNLADKVSFGMGTPTNIGAWLLAVVIWFVLGFTFPSLWTSQHSFLPAWFTSTSWNFPLNTVTTLAELYIGFLVAAAANRTERHNKAQADRIEKLEKLVIANIKENTDATKEIHEHVIPNVQEIHELLHRLIDHHD